MRSARDTRAKIFDREGIRAWAAEQRSNGKKIGFTCGAFDILHAGHVEYLTEAHDYCDVLIVAVNSDESIRTYKSDSRPINGQEHRMTVVAALEAVHAVTLMEETRPTNLIQLLRPDVYIKGGDYKVDALQSKPMVEAYGGNVVSIPIRSRISTTAILERAGLVQWHEKVPQAENAGERRLVFLDRDGTLIRDIPFLHDPARVELLPGVLEGLKELQDAGFTLVMITNQQGIGLGYYSEAEFIEVNRALFRKLAPAGIQIARIYYCPHSLADRCNCRKPGAVLLERALSYFRAESRASYLIGDSVSDCQAAASAGCLSVLVGESGDSEVSCTYRASSFQDAVHWILSA